jgi:catechol 2,3-dioxygenase-like lactoylglutathione lyase family enzyme
MLADGRVEATVPVRSLKIAQEFYEGAVGLQPSGSHTPGVDVVYECGGGTHLMLYEWPGSRSPGQTVAHVVVRDVADTVRDLRDRGIRFDEYDTPRLTTIDGVATIGDRHYAWFHDPDDNVIGIHD